MEYNLGNKNQYKEFPCSIKINRSIFFLTKNELNEYILLSSVCPHMGGRVVDKGDNCLVCPAHNWEFNKRNGKSINVPNHGLVRYLVTERYGNLYVDLPQHILTKDKRKVKVKKGDLKFKLHAHACLEIFNNEFSLITDPWLEGPAFLGAWIQYPPPLVKSSDLNPDAIWISHEHSDHFHEETLNNFDKKTPIYFPDFPNKRIVKKLQRLGFTNINPMAFGVTYTIGRDFKITCFEPVSLWNDSILLVETLDFRFLNLNDAGLNNRIADKVGPVDMIATGFSPGASGYPLTWTHLSDEKSNNIMDSACLGILDMLKQATDLYGANKILPFASHFLLWHPLHKRYWEKLRKNTINDVVQEFLNTNVQVIDLLPGESWDAKDNTFNYIERSREILFSKDTQLKYAKEKFDNIVFSEIQSELDIPIEELIKLSKEYFLRLNDVPEIIFCEELVVTLKATSLDFNKEYFELSFSICNGELTILETIPSKSNLEIKIPVNILRVVIKEDLSWDEVHIGYWCQFSRNPDIYNANFWRLLQTPYYKKKVDFSIQDKSEITHASIIADLLETYGDEVDRVIRRYGLYCFGCLHSTNESIEQGAVKHGVSSSNIKKLIKELNQVLNGGAF